MESFKWHLLIVHEQYYQQHQHYQDSAVRDIGWSGRRAVGLAGWLAIGLDGHVLSHPGGAAVASRIAPPPMANCTVKERRPDRKARADFLPPIHRGSSTAAHPVSAIRYVYILQRRQAVLRSRNHSFFCFSRGQIKNLLIHIVESRITSA